MRENIILFNLRKRLNERYEDVSGMELYQRQSKLAIWQYE
jgi:hypothetical protein